MYFVMGYIPHNKKNFNFNRIPDKFNDLLLYKNIRNDKAFRYDKPLSRMIYKYKTFSKNLNKSTNDNLFNCRENKYKAFVNSPYGHILTGHLDIVSYRNQRESSKRVYMSYGKNYRINRMVTKTNAKKRMTVNVDIFIQKLTYRHILPDQIFRNGDIVF